MASKRKPNWLMTARQTAKLQAAVTHALNIGIELPDSREELYAAIEAKGYYWSAKTEQWDKDNPTTGSVFEDHTGAPSGHCKIRLMAHPDDMEAIVDILTEVLIDYDFRVWVEHDEQYRNRNGAGVRMYLAGQLLPKEEM